MRLLKGLTLSVLLLVFACLMVAPVAAQTLPPTYNGLTGHFPVDADGSPQYRTDGWGVSFYSSVYPLKPGMDAWTQLGWGTWLLANAYEDADGNWSPVPEGAEFCTPDSVVPTLFQSLEGGVGTWENVKFPIPMSMFLINATADCYNNMIGGPAYFSGGDVPIDAEHLYFAQLSNRLLLPTGPVLYEDTTEPQVVGAGWLALPIVPAGASPYGIPTGPNNWTLFLNTANFKGPVGFFTPPYWTSLVHEPGNSGDSVGYGLDTRNSMTASPALEVGFTNAFSATDSSGTEYRRIPRLTFAADENNRAVLLQDHRRYFKTALWDAFAAWVDGGPAPTGIDSAGIWESTFHNPYSTVRMIGEPGEPVEFGTVMESVVFTTAGGGSAYGLQWDGTVEAGVLPEYYKRVDGTWYPIPPSEVPADTHLAEQTFPQMTAQAPTPLDTSASSPWASTGWAAGPFRVALGNDSVAEYVWYRFIDQPALKRLPLDSVTRDKLQAWAESVHQAGPLGGLTIAPPSSGELASLDPGQLVVPPFGMSVGYVPITIAQLPETIFRAGFE